MKLLKVNMTTQSIAVENLAEEYQGLGGRGLTSVLINDGVPPECDPLGPENKLIFAPGTLSGTSLVNTSRLSVGAKSPLTGGIKESNVGGTVAAALGRLGISAVVVEGHAPEGEPFFLKIDENGEATLVSALDYKGTRTYALVEKIYHEAGDQPAVLCIGPAGEFQLASASIQSSDADGRPCRAAGRGGLGAVMGSKGLKALIVSTSGKSPDAMADPAAFKKAAKIFAKAVKEDMFSGYVLPPLGTAVLVAPINAAGAFPSYNATSGVFDGWEKISGEALADTLKERGGKITHMGCAQCIIHCSNEFVDQQSNYVTASLEYETIWAMGGMCGIDDLDVIARLDFLSDDIGVDTMNTGVAMAVAMDAGYKSFADAEAAIAMVEEIAAGTEFGRILGNGPAAVGRHFNHHRVPVVKNQSIAAYDPRAIQGMGVTYATSPMGADHTAGNVIDKNLDSLGGSLNPLKADGQVEVSREYQIDVAAFDCTGLCLFANSAVHSSARAGQALMTMINAKFGTELTEADKRALGIRVLQAEREFNQRAGFTKADDRLAKFFYEESLPPHNTVVVVSDEDMDGTFGSGF
ncbi:aldehyde:ferredoxin oxidoreductase [Alkalispirochaeta odontotermitis]|nr:aldehyde:ferredoxin oxidoreductase [Alkalispirochaeta odontotermitis]CAB1083482.1 Tungsten-containing aldehyde:ferredoxin oxidoreductase (EC [Olavius algarvensis Delta 1 endosymbiont]